MALGTKSQDFLRHISALAVVLKAILRKFSPSERAQLTDNTPVRQQEPGYIAWEMDSLTNVANRDTFLHQSRIEPTTHETARPSIGGTTLAMPPSVLVAVRRSPGSIRADELSLPAKIFVRAFDAA